MGANDLTILAIDDKPDNLTALKAVVADAFPHARFLAALDGGRGLALARAEDPDVVVLEILMPGMDGFEVCRRLKGDERTRDIPVLFLTGRQADRASRVQALETGAEAFLAKPIDESELTAQIRAMVKIKAANRLQRLEKEQLAELVVARTRELEQELAERKVTEGALRASEVRYRRLFESAKDGILILDHETGTIVDVNPFLIALLGFSREALLEKKVWELGFFRNIVASQANFAELREKEYIRYEDLPLETADGRQIEVEFVSNVYEVNRYKVIQCNVRDITERKKVEEALRESEERYRTIIEQAADAILVHDEIGRILDVNRKACEILGYSREELLARSIGDIDPEAIPVHKRELWDRVLAGEQVTFESRQVGKAGNVIPVEVTLGSVRLPLGPAILGIVRDITERKQAEAALRESEARFRRFLELAPLPLCHVTKDRVIDFRNERFVLLFGYTADEVPTDDEWWPRAYPDPQYRQWVIETWNDAVRRAAAGDRDIVAAEYKITCKNGEERIVEISGITLGEEYLSAFVDITERKRAEEKIKSQLDELRRWHDVMLGREDRVQELKREVNDLCRRLGEAGRYPSQEAGPDRPRSGQPEPPCSAEGEPIQGKGE